ncbi:MAG: ion transporter [Litorivicinaceae bacterium]|jgi:voltage-gated potassium channel|nr:ion transporter [Litorivicinaceae bacterium]MDP5328914.1 ion transporter [Litorivicinaceae bacterium]MDP5341235.1 ion transporter [Litorivicinaceae bacterium]MDP5342092.1 ion transporter [Litorivicinaceae bacterium]MDP5363255.1 ion transporter [Litorivicinaceae bacterium]
MKINQQRIAEIINKGGRGDRASRQFDLALSILIIANILAVSLESVSTLGNKFGVYFLVFEIFSATVFLIEYLLRIWTAPNFRRHKRQSSLKSRLAYVFSLTGMIDLLATLPSLLQFMIPGSDLRWIRAIRLIRLLKMSHYSSAIEDLYSAIYDERRAFGAALYLLFIALFLSSAAMYVAENSAQPDKFSSIPETMWWALITLTTVGYGDVSPITPVGKIIGAFTALSGVCTVALLTGIVGSAFASQMAKRKAIFEAEVQDALADGVLSEDEARRIEKLRREFSLSEEHAIAIIRSISDQKRS